ncbi:MAG: ester cyclase [Euryarchaeota archaeon]|nr:ester cyclase [Euryarchaeota archaeon]
MSLEDNKAVVRRLYDAFNTGDLKAMDSVLAPDAVDFAPREGQTPGIEGFKENITALRSSFPDLSLSIETMIAEGNRVAERVTIRGTHRGEFIGVPASGNQMTVAAMAFNLLAGGKIVERGRIIDTFGLMQQIQT